MKILSQIYFKILSHIIYFKNKFSYKYYSRTAYIASPSRINGKQFITIKDSVVIQKYSWLFAGKFDEFTPELIINEGCAIGDFNHITAVRKVVIGKNVLTANRVYISDNLHNYEDISTPIMHQGVRFKGEVIIGDGTWIGENACIIGAKIGKNCVIGANAVVTKDIPDYCVVVGAPARTIKKYNQDKKIWENI